MLWRFGSAVAGSAGDGPSCGTKAAPRRWGRAADIGRHRRRKRAVLRFIGGTIGVIFLIGLLVVIGVLALIF